MAAAIKKIDAVNQPDKGLTSDDPIVLYANQQQLRVVTGILVQERFPSTTDYPGKAQTNELGRKIAEVGQSYQCGS